MSTSNFSPVNTSCYYAFGFNKYFDQETIDANDLQQDCLGEFDETLTRLDYEDAVNSVSANFEEAGWLDLSQDRDALAAKNVYEEYGGAAFEIVIKAYTKGGYYEGAVFDIDGEVTVFDQCGHACGMYDLFGEYTADERDVIADNWTGNAGLNRLQARNIINHLSQVSENLREEAEFIFSRHCEERFTVLARFSNGETIYGRNGVK